MKAGVLVGTVSRTLAGNSPVSEATRARVKAAVKGLHYVVHVHAKALSGGVAGPIALVLQDITGPSLAHVAAGAALERENHLADDHVVLSAQLVIRQSVRPAK